MAAISVLAMSGCASYVKRAEFDSAIAELHATNTRVQEQINGLSEKYDAVVTQLAGRMRVDASAHFATNESVLSEQDKALLDDFAKVIRGSHSDSVITVEGFAEAPAHRPATDAWASVGLKQCGTIWCRRADCRPRKCGR